MHRPNSVYKALLSVFVCLPMVFNARAGIKTWTGLAGDGLWATATNWDSHTLPAPDDEVVLDQSVSTSDYQVQLPDQPVQLLSLHILPDAGHTIRLLLPVTNLAAPGLSVAGSIVLEAGAIFENASGIASGESLLITDSLRINNGGKYIHRTRAAHAASIVNHLSTGTGTETGTFEFDVPRSSYTISASNRIYGTLSLRADALGAPVNYTCSGNNPLTLRGDLRINENTQFSVDLSGTAGNVFVGGDLIESGGVFNVASGTGNSTQVRVSGNVIQSAGALITATAAAAPVLDLSGSSLQAISLGGTLAGSVGFRLDNPAGALLVAPLTLPYSLELFRGRLISSASNLLSLSADCRVICDTAQTLPAYVDGPLKKIGLTATPYFLFPVGKNGQLHWLEIKNGTGDFVAEYMMSNPRDISMSCASGLDHVSAEEYWQLQSGPAAAGSVELSYHMPASGVVTDPAFLTVATLLANTWNNVGNTGVTGDYHGGSVCSDPLAITGLSDFTLGSTTNLENPLPLTRIDWTGKEVDADIWFRWTTDLPSAVAYFELWCGPPDGLLKLDSIPSFGDSLFTYRTRNQLGRDLFYQLRAVDAVGNKYVSTILHFGNRTPAKKDCRIIGNPVRGDAVSVECACSRRSAISWAIYSPAANKVQQGTVTASTNSGTIAFPVPTLASGFYVLRINDGTGTCVLRLLKE